jgi:hypothetical protein
VGPVSALDIAISASLMLRTSVHRLGHVLQRPIVRHLFTRVDIGFARLLYNWNLARQHWEPVLWSRSNTDVPHDLDVQS